MALSIADYLLQLPENMNFAKVQELSGEDSLYYRMLSDYGSGSFQLIRFENDLLMILIADYTPKETFEKIATISEEYMEISQFETDSSSFKIGRRKTQPVGKGIYCYVNTQKTTYVYCEKGKPVRFTKIILTRKYFDTYFRVHYGKDYEQSKVAKEYLLKNPNLPELNFVFQQIRDCQAVGQTLHLYLESKVLELLSLVIKGMEQKENHISVKLDYKDIRDLKKTVTYSSLTTPNNSSILASLIFSPGLFFITHNLLCQIHICHRYFTFRTMHVDTNSFCTCLCRFY